MILGKKKYSRGAQHLRLLHLFYRTALCGRKGVDDVIPQKKVDDFHRSSNIDDLLAAFPKDDSGA